MESIKITDRKIRLMINDDESKIIAFDPQDVGFVNRYYGLIDFLNTKQAEYISEGAAIDESAGSEQEKQRNGLKLLEKMCRETKEQFDVVFGTGTMDRIFGDTLRLDMFEELLYGIAPYINKARQKKLDQYTPKTNGGVLK